MSRNPNKLLTILLALLIGIGPAASAVAGSRLCASGTGMDTMGMVHGDHQLAKGLDETGDSAASMQNCDSCDKGCCAGGVCSMTHCSGVTVTLQSVITLEFDGTPTDEAEPAGDRPLAGQRSAPFRPPQA